MRAGVDGSDGRWTKVSMVRAGFLTVGTEPALVRAILKKVRLHHGGFCPRRAEREGKRPHYGEICPVGSTAGAPTMGSGAEGFSAAPLHRLL